MTIWRLIRQSLRFYWRTHLSVMMGATVSTAVLVGGLAVGDSVRRSLQEMARARLGETQFALVSNGRFFRSALADDLAGEAKASVAPVLQLRGIVTHPDSRVRANQVQVLGVDESFWQLGSGPGRAAPVDERSVVLNDRLAEQLAVQVGDEVLLRVEKPDVLPRDAPLSTDEALSLAVRLPVGRIIGAKGFGHFSLRADQLTPASAFVDLAWLQETVGLAARANLLLVGQGADGSVTAAELDVVLKRHLTLADANLELRVLDDLGVLELRTSRIFLEESMIRSAALATYNSVQMFSYFVNALQVGERSTPYSIVSAVDAQGQEPLGADEIAINEWLAEDLQAQVDDELRLRYYVMGPMRKLEERQRSFTIRSIIPVIGGGVDREMMPAFPGLHDAESCRDWDPGFTIDLDRLRDKDQAYWDDYRGTPKALVNLQTARGMWGNRFGDMTAMRYAADAADRHDIEEKILEQLEPAALGYQFSSVRAEAMAASTEGMDFGGLFLGFSFFIIAAALLLMALLFALGVEQRTSEVGVLLALGFLPNQVRRCLLIEGAAVALPGVALGMVAGMVYTQALVWGLATVWRGAAGNSAIVYHVGGATLLIGGVAGFLTALATIWLALRGQVRLSARELVAGGRDGQDLAPKGFGKRWSGAILAVAAMGGAVALLAGTGGRMDARTSETFFGVGSLLLVAGLGFSHAMLGMWSRRRCERALSLTGLGLGNMTRRRGRSLAVIVLLACGSFIVLAVEAYRLEPEQSARRRSAGTGGFALFGKSSMPVYHDLNSPEGRDFYGLDEADLGGVEVVPVRVRDGDDASCLNLNRAQQPRLLGVRPEVLHTRAAFTFTHIENKEFQDRPWMILDEKRLDGAIPAIADHDTVLWGLGKSLGDDLRYTDEAGHVFRLRVVGMLKSSVLQGNVIISEDNFTARFPSEGGYRTFLIDAPAQRVTEIATILSQGLEDVGLTLTPAARRLAQFMAVQNTYLSIFQVLGGLGLLLGSVGLALVVMRNVLERRGEFGMLRAVGFDRPLLQRLVLYEHWALLVMGLVCGVMTAAVAVLPAMRSVGGQIPYATLVVTNCVVIGGGVLWVWLATKLALKGELMAALRAE